MDYSPAADHARRAGITCKEQALKRGKHEGQPLVALRASMT